MSVAGNLPELDPEGFLVNLQDWSPQVAEYLAAQDKIKLTPEHLEIILLLRDFYQTYQLSPAMRPLTKYLRQHLAAEKTSSIYLMQLFGQSPAKALARYAGLPKPDNCL
ncbi:MULTISPECIES: TusE/DsrC/DsvC family sulfur relay protein [Marinospirillum]|uniref:Sulfurtransferase n=1 Tax=Marinospirillum insulare TaxID=217169 RepID=A0ABQ5ZVQ8_9GAMM|nr:MULTISPECIES: TusE/DsrC/DsvC family sulfur relay protein [Marinospirillum]GLR63102.1 sulfurtransferase [Marinospirillum insulare]